MSERLQFGLGEGSEVSQRREIPSAVCTPNEVLEEMKQILPGAKRVRMIFLNALGGSSQPLAEIAPLLKEIGEVGGEVLFGVSGSHRKLFPQGEAKTLYFPRGDDKEKNVAQKEKTDRTYSDLAESNVSIVDTKANGIPSRIIGFANHVHSKWIQVDDGEKVITYLPEFNLDNATVKVKNFALRFEETAAEASQNHSLSAIVEKYITRVLSGEPFVDYEEKVTNELTFLADSGKPGRSLIRDKAREMITDDSVNDIVFVSQFPPAGATLTALLESAQRDKAVLVLLSEDCKTEFQQGLIARYLARSFDRRATSIKNFKVLYYPGKIHSKWLLTNTGITVGEDAFTIDPVEQKAKGMATSNNLHPAGYSVGTGESGLSIADQGLLTKMRAALIPLIEESLH